MSSAESQFCLLDSLVRRAERLCEGELCCFGLRRMVSALSWLYKIYHRVNLCMNEYLNDALSSFKSAMNLCLLGALLDFFESLFKSLFAVL